MCVCVCVFVCTYITEAMDDSSRKIVHSGVPSNPRAGETNEDECFRRSLPWSPSSADRWLSFCLICVRILTWGRGSSQHETHGENVLRSGRGALPSLCRNIYIYRERERESYIYVEGAGRQIDPKRRSLRSRESQNRPEILQTKTRNAQ